MHRGIRLQSIHARGVKGWLFVRGGSISAVVRSLVLQVYALVHVIGAYPTALQPLVLPLLARCAIIYPTS